MSKDEPSLADRAETAGRRAAPHARGRRHPAPSRAWPWAAAAAIALLLLLAGAVGLRQLGVI